MSENRIVFKVSLKFTLLIEEKYLIKIGNKSWKSKQDFKALPENLKRAATIPCNPRKSDLSVFTVAQYQDVHQLFNNTRKLIINAISTVDLCICKSQHSRLGEI